MNKKLAESDIYSKFKQYKKIKTSPIYVYGKRELFQADLAFFTAPHLIKANKGYTYLLCIIDCFTKKTWLFPLEDKTSQNVYEKFKILFDQLDYLPKKIQTDKGTEFLGRKLKKLFKDNDVIHYLTNTDRKAAIVERFIRTFKRILFQIMVNSKSHKWSQMLPLARNIYLSRYHRTIKMSPNEAEQPENQAELRKTFHKFFSKYPIEKKPKFKVGDTVRIYGLRGIYTRGFYQSYTDEFFTIAHVKSLPLNRSRYYLRDEQGNILSAVFFENELSLYTPSKETYYDIDKILKERVYKKKKQYLVTWVGWPESSASWVDASNIKNIVQ